MLQNLGQEAQGFLFKNQVYYIDYASTLKFYFKLGPGSDIPSFRISKRKAAGVYLRRWSILRHGRLAITGTSPGPVVQYAKFSHYLFS